MWFQKIRVCLKELRNESLQSNRIDVGVRVEELEFDLDVALLNKFQQPTSKKQKPTTVSESLSPPSSSPCFRFDIVAECHGKAGRRVRLGSSCQPSPAQARELGRDGDV
jgi:hypothetical protein